MQIAVDQPDPPGLPVQRPRIAVRRLEDVDGLIPAGDPAQPRIGHRRLGGGDRDEAGQRTVGVAGLVALYRSVEQRGAGRSAAVIETRALLCGLACCAQEGLLGFERRDMHIGGERRGGYPNRRRRYLSE